MSIHSTGLGRRERGVARLTYSVDEAAKVLGIGRNRAYEAASRGEIPTIRIGKRVLVPKAALDRMLGLPVSEN
jgi:excisionase family DNA binding protein